MELELMRRRAADRLARAGHPWPAQAALLLAARGQRGLGRQEFAAAIGIPESLVVSIEDGVTAEE